MRHVVGGDVGQALGENHELQFCDVVCRERGANEVFIRRTGSGDEVLALVLDGSLEVGFLLWGFEGRPTDAAAINLLEVEILAVVMVKSGLRQGKESGGEVLVALGVEMKDGGFGAGGRRIDAGAGKGRLRDFAERSAEIR